MSRRAAVSKARPSAEFVADHVIAVGGALLVGADGRDTGANGRDVGSAPAIQGAPIIGKAKTAMTMIVPPIGLLLE